MKITKISYIGNRLYAHICPLCGAILASVTEKEMMPEFSICECDRNGNKLPVYEIFEGEGGPMIRRNKWPRFVGHITFGQMSDIEIVDIIDRDADVMEMAKAMKKAGEFLIKSNFNKS